MASFIYPDTQRIAVVTAIKTPYATGLLKLFKSPIGFTPDLDEASLTAIEADFSGYAAITLTTLPAVFLDTINGGVSFQIPTVQYNCASTVTIANPIYGGWIENAAGDLLTAWQMNNPWMMDAPHKALPLGLMFNFFGTNEVYVDIAGVPQ